MNPSDLSNPANPISPLHPIWWDDDVPVKTKQEQPSKPSEINNSLGAFDIFSLVGFICFVVVLIKLNLG